jgi:hypothetical protein
MQAKLKYKPQDDRKIKISVGIKQGPLLLLQQKK